MKISPSVSAWLLSWEMVMLNRKVRLAHIFMKQGAVKLLIHSNTLLFPSILVHPHCTATPSWAFLSQKTSLIVQLWCWMIKISLLFWVGDMTQFLCPVTLVTFKKTVCIEFPSIVYGMWIDYKRKRYFPVRLSTVCVHVCLCVPLWVCVLNLNCHPCSVRIRSILY